MASLSSLRSELNYWNGKANELSAKIKKLKKRLQEVKSIQNALKSTSGGNASDVNSRLRSSGERLDGAINYSGKDCQINSILAGKEERTIGADNNLTSADVELQREISDIERKIAEAERELEHARRKIADLKAAIAMEEKREREKAARKNVVII